MVSGTLAPTQDTETPPARQWGGSVVMQRLSLAGVLLLAALLNLVGLSGQGYGNTYYAAAVKSMLTSWHAFFFASFDAGGFVGVDKPPLGLWVQAASAKLFGFSGVSLMAPQAIAGVLSVAVLYHLVQRAFGSVAGLVAALALALMPVSVVVNRNNTMDGLLILTLLLAAWAVSRAAETGRLSLLLLGAALVGAGFNIKMLQAYLVVPAFALAYLLLSPVSTRRRLVHLGLAGVVLFAVLFAWVAIVDLTPAGARPYVGSSGTDSALSLVLGYNGLGRLTEALVSDLPVLRVLNVSIDLEVAPGFAPGIGDTGPLRLLNPGVAGQASWLLPLALAGSVVGAWRVRSAATAGVGRPALRQRRVALVVWGGWLVTCAAYFSVSRFFHLYYLVMLAPAVAALAGIGVAVLWREYRSGGVGGWLLPVALAGTALVQWRILSAYPDWSGWLVPLIAGASIVGAAVLAAARLRSEVSPVVLASVAAIAVLGLLLAPAVWSAVSVRDGNGGAWLPQAGPALAQSFPSGAPRGMPNAGPRAVQDGQGVFPRPAAQGAPSVRGGQGAMTFAGDQWNSLDPGLVAYLVANQGEARYLVATATSSYASLFILATDQPAMALGGYQGWDRILTPEQLAALVAGGTVRFFYLSATPAGNAFGGGQDATADLVAWVGANCSVVPSERWQSSPADSDAVSADSVRGFDPSAGGPAGNPGRAQQQLYDCAASAA